MVGPAGLGLLGAAYGQKPGDDRSYHDFVRDTAAWEYADEHHLRAIALILGVRVVVVPRYASWAIASHGDGPPHRTIFLGNDDAHYVWLAPGPAAPSSPPGAAEADVIDLLEDSEEGSGSGAEASAPAQRRFAAGNTVGLKSRFKKARRHYGTCRECGSSERTVSKKKDWYCKGCKCYTRKRTWKA